jgi:hypothetical protein
MEWTWARWERGTQGRKWFRRLLGIRKKGDKLATFPRHCLAYPPGNELEMRTRTEIDGGDAPVRYVGFPR